MEARFTQAGHVARDPYLRDIWRPSIGGDRRSCVFAISESLLTVELD